MSLQLRVRGWLRALLKRDEIERGMSDEMRLHLDRATERLIARGLSPSDARDEALREFGHVSSIEEEARDARGVRWIEEVAQDLRFGLRALVHAPSFTIVVVLSLVLGIGVNTAIFTAVNGLMRPRAIHEPRTFVSISTTWSKPAYDYLLTHTPSLSELIVRSDENALLAPTSAADSPRRVAIELVSGNYFSALHAPMAVGRSLRVADLDRGAEPVAVLNYRAWKSHFAGDPAIVGRVVRLTNGAAATIVGVAGMEFSGVRRGGPDLWMPITFRGALPSATQAAPPRGDWFGSTSYLWLTLYGRIAAGHSASEVQSQINVAVQQMALSDSSLAADLARRRLVTVTAEGSSPDAQRYVKAMFIAATFIVLLVACFNVASLTLARAMERRREIAVRLSLGANRARIVRQLITESAIVVGTGAVVAFALSTWTLRVLAASGGLSFITDDDPERVARLVTPDLRVFLFALGTAALSVAACGLIPALRATRVDLASEIKSHRDGFAGNRRSRMRAWLTMAQVALSVVLLVAAGILTRSMTRALSLDIGFDRDRVLSVTTALRLTGYDSTRVRVLSDAFEQRLTTLPGVRSVSRGDVPLVGGRFKTILTVPAQAGNTAETHDGYLAAVKPSYFETLGIPIVRGRSFNDAELRSHAKVVVISEATARKLWPNDDPLGKVIGVDPLKKGRIAPETVMPSAVVIGVARDAQMVNLAEIPTAYVYVPSANGGTVLRADGDATALLPMIREAARAIDRNLLVTVTPLSEMIASNGGIYNVRVAMGFATAIGILALTLAAVGIFGLMAYTVSQRERELGIRVALGARGVDIAWLAVGHGLRVVSAGAAIGVLLGAAGTRLLRALLFGMTALDPLVYGGVVIVVATIALVACYVPARRAVRVDPLVALKSE